MYINFLNDRKSIGYGCLADVECGNRLVYITDSSVVGVKNFSLTGKQGIAVFLAINTAIFSGIISAEAVGLPMPPKPVIRVQPSSQDDSKVQIAKVIPRKKDLIVYKPSKERLFLMYLTDRRLSSNQEVLKLVKEFRGGSWGFVETAALLGLIVLIFSMGEGFVHNNPNPGWGLDRPDPFQPPTVKYRYPPILNVLNPRRTSPSDHRGSVLLEGRMNEMCPIQGDENGFVMSYDEAYRLVAETYPGYIEVNDNCRITDWQSGKHIYHAPGMGINPADYGFTQKDLERIRGEEEYKGGGLIAYARRGYRLPPIEMVRAYSEKLKESCEQASIRATKVPFYDANGEWSTTVYLIPPLEGEKRGIMIVFNESTKDLITGGKQRRNAFTRLEEEGFIGSPKWRMEWNNSTIGPMHTPACEFSSLDEGQNSEFTPLSSFDNDVRGITPLDSSSLNS